MDNIKFNKIAQVIANDKGLQDKMKNAKSKEESYNLLKNVAGGCSKEEAKKFLYEAYNRGSSQVLTEDQLEEVSGGSFRGFMATCMLGLTLLPVASSLTSQLNTAHAWGSGGPSISYEGGKVRSFVASVLAGNNLAQSSHEKITVASYLNSKGKKEGFDAYLNELKGGTNSSEAIKLKSLEEGSYWNDFFTTEQINMFQAYAFKSYVAGRKLLGDVSRNYIDTKGNVDIGEEVEHLLLTLCESKGKVERVKFSHNYRGNYLHCMEMHDNDGETSLGQSGTYQAIMQWLEFAVAYAKVGSCVDISVDDAIKIVEAKSVEDDGIKKILDKAEIKDFAAAKHVLSHPEMKVLVMTDEEVINYAKKKYGSKELEKFKKYWVAAKNLYKGRTNNDANPQSDANKAGLIFLAEKIMVSTESDIQKLRNQVSVDQEENFDWLRNQDDSVKFDDEYSKNRAAGMACHTIEDSFNPAHCDRQMSYTNKGGEWKVKYGGIKSFMDYALQQPYHSKFDMISKDDFDENLFEDQGKIKTAGLKEAVENVTEFLKRMYGEDSAKDIMSWIGENVITFDPSIAKVNAYTPYTNIPKVQLTEGGEYNKFVTPDGGSLICDLNMFLPVEELNDDQKTVINQLRGLIDQERSAVLAQDFNRANKCATLIKGMLMEGGKVKSVKSSGGVTKTIEVDFNATKLQGNLAKLKRDYDTKTCVDIKDAERDTEDILKRLNNTIAIENVFRDKLKNSAYKNYELHQISDYSEYDGKVRTYWLERQLSRVKLEYSAFCNYATDKELQTFMKARMDDAKKKFDDAKDKLVDIKEVDDLKEQNEQMSQYETKQHRIGRKKVAHGWGKEDDSLCRSEFYCVRTYDDVMYASPSADDGVIDDIKRNQRQGLMKDQLDEAKLEKAIWEANDKKTGKETSEFLQHRVNFISDIKSLQDANLGKLNYAGLKFGKSNEDVFKKAQVDQWKDSKITDWGKLKPIVENSLKAYLGDKAFNEAKDAASKAAESVSNIDVDAEKVNQLGDAASILFVLNRIDEVEGRGESIGGGQILAKCFKEAMQNVCVKGKQSRDNQKQVKTAMKNALVRLYLHQCATKFSVDMLGFWKDTAEGIFNECKEENSLDKLDDKLKNATCEIDGRSLTLDEFSLPYVKGYVAMEYFLNKLNTSTEDCYDQIKGKGYFAHLEGQNPLGKQTNLMKTQAGEPAVSGKNTGNDGKAAEQNKVPGSDVIVTWEDESPAPEVAIAGAAQSDESPAPVAPSDASAPDLATPATESAASDTKSAAVDIAALKKSLGDLIAQHKTELDANDGGFGLLVAKEGEAVEARKGITKGLNGQIDAISKIPSISSADISAKNQAHTDAIRTKNDEITDTTKKISDTTIVDADFDQVGADVASIRFVLERLKDANLSASAVAVETCLQGVLENIEVDVKGNVTVKDGEKLKAALKNALLSAKVEQNMSKLDKLSAKVKVLDVKKILKVEKYSDFANRRITRFRLMLKNSDEFKDDYTQEKKAHYVDAVKGYLAWQAISNDYSTKI